MLELIRNTIIDFCAEFIKNPYLCYTEHGQHALFYSMLLDRMTEEEKYIDLKGQKICTVQKEYPTATDLDRSKRQHWDIAILQNPPQTSQREDNQSFDFLNLLAVIEFGLNENREHLEDDIDRLCHEGANVEHRFIIHLYRLSEGGNKFSNRDWSPESQQIVPISEIQNFIIKKPIEVFYAVSNTSGKTPSGFWILSGGVNDH